MVLAIESILCVHAKLKLKPRFDFYSTQRLELFENLEKVEPNFLSLSLKNQVLILLYGSLTSNSESLNEEIL